MSSSLSRLSRNLRAASRGILVAAVVVAAACGQRAPSVAPSALAANPATYDNQDVTVTGTAKNPTTRPMRRGTATVYQLCDSACIAVVQFGDTNVSDGDTTTVTGRFHASFGRRAKMSDVLVVGGRMGHFGGGAASPSP